MNTSETLYLEKWRELVSHKGACSLTYENGIELEVLDGVFNPSTELTFSTKSVIINLPELNGKKVLDMGCGTGVLSLIAAKRGASEVLGVDNCPLANLCANGNVKRNNLSRTVEIRDSSLFSNISEKFDVILANLPIFYESQANMIDRFFSQLSLHCKAGATVLITGASFGNWNNVQAKIDKYSLNSNPPTYDEYKYSEFGVNWYVGRIKFGDES
jgi:ribosomal protein L11 methylase PrmA